MGETEAVTSYAFIDLDRFSEINNEYGHAFGDEVLEEITSFGEEFAEEEWEFSREYGDGGDEFVMIMPGIDKDTATSRMEQLRAELEAFEPKGETVTASIGVATIPDDGGDEDDVIDKADLAMLNVEDWGGNGVTAYGNEDPTKTVEVWFEEVMLIEEDDLLTIERWIDHDTSIRAVNIYNESKGIPNKSNIAGSAMTVPKHEKQIEGVVKEIKEFDSSTVRFDMRARKERLEELGF